MLREKLIVLQEQTEKQTQRVKQQQKAHTEQALHTMQEEMDKREEEAVRIVVSALLSETM